MTRVSIRLSSICNPRVCVADLPLRYISSWPKNGQADYPSPWRNSVQAQLSIFPIIARSRQPTTYDARAVPALQQ